MIESKLKQWIEDLPSYFKAYLPNLLCESWVINILITVNYTIGVLSSLYAGLLVSKLKATAEISSSNRNEEEKVHCNWSTCVLMKWVILPNVDLDMNLEGKVIFR